MSRVFDAVFGGGTRNLEDPGVGASGTNILKALRGAASDAGVYVTPDTAMRFTAVYRAVSLIAGTIAGMPLHTFRRQPGARVPYDSQLLQDPHPDKTPFELWEYNLTSALLHGDALDWKLRDASGRIRYLWPLHPSKVNIEGTKPTTANPSGKIFEVQDPPEGSQRGFTKDQVFHVPSLSLDGLQGLSPIQHVARQAIGIGLAADRFGARMFGRGMLVQGILKTDKKFKNEADVERLRKRWAERTTGDDNQWGIPVLDDGAEFEKIGLPPQDAQYIEIRKFQIVDIARCFGLPPHLLSDVERSTSWGTGIEQQNIGLVVYTLSQWTNRFEQRITKELLPSGAHAKFSMAALLRGDARSRAEYHKKMRDAGAETGSEIRELEDMEPLPGAGDLWRPTAMKSVNPNVAPWEQGQEPPAGGATEEGSDAEDE